jgi:hypothetical protein
MVEGLLPSQFNQLIRGLIMKKYVFVNLSPLMQKFNYFICSVTALTILYGFTGSIPICNAVVLLGGAVALKQAVKGSYLLDKMIKNNLYSLVKNNDLYCEKQTKEGPIITYRPEIYYSYDDNFINIKIRIDGSRFRDVYTDLENILEDLFVMECVDKEHAQGYMTYKLARVSTERLNAVNIKAVEGDLIPINTKLSWNFRKCPHALISGGTGKGKTFFLAYLIKMFTLLKADVKIIDPKLSDLSYLEIVLRDNVVSSPGQIAKLLRETKEHMDERYEQFRHLTAYGFGKDYKDYGFKPIVIIFDEVAAFIASIDKKLSREIEDYMTEIILKGRQAGVFMILTTQRPDADVIKTSIRDQLGLRIALGEMSKTGYTMVFGSEFKDLELNNSAPGNGYIFIDGLHTKPLKFQSPLFENNYNFVRDLREIAR